LSKTTITGTYCIVYSDAAADDAVPRTTDSIPKYRAVIIISTLVESFFGPQETEEKFFQKKIQKIMPQMIPTQIHIVGKT
jgi:hypothetical protein